MNVRRTLVVAVIAIGLIAGVAVASRSRAETTTRFADVAQVTRPYASHRDPITSTWYCPGVPAGDDTVGGEVHVANPTDVALLGTVTVLGTDGVAPTTVPITVPPRDTLRVRLDDVVTASFLSAVVEIDGGEGMVEQRAITPAGDAVASCTTQTSNTWYFADGYTVDDSVEQLVLTNPSAAEANIDLTFVTASATRQPSAFQGYAVPAHSVKVISIAENGYVDEAVIGVTLTTTSGRLVVAKAQRFLGSARGGYSLTLGAPALADQSWFAAGQTAPGVTEQYVIYNPTDDDVTVDVLVLGVAPVPGFVDPDPLAVPAGAVVTFDMATVSGLPQGPHSMVFSTLAAAAIVVERVQDVKVGDAVATSVVLGMTEEYVVTRWYVPIGVDTATDAALVVQNVDNVDATVTVEVVGPGGAVAAPGLDALALPASGILSIPLTDPTVFGRPLVVESTQRVFVERSLPRGHELGGRSGSWALPECGACNFSLPHS